MPDENKVTGTENQEQTVTSTSTEQTAEQRYKDLYGEEKQVTQVTIPEELTTSITAMREELAALRAQSTRSSESTSTKEPSFVELLREGKVEEAEALMARRAAAAAGKDLEAKLSAIETTMSERREIDREVEKFVTDLRGKNPEIALLEDLITVRAQAKMQSIPKDRLSTAASFVREYKKVVLEAVEDAKKIAQQLRGAGKDEAMTTRTTVLSSSPLSPTGVTAHGDKETEAKEPDVSPQSYIAARQAKLNQSRGASVRVV